MQINILCIGDVVGRPGRHVISQAMPHLVKQYDLHFVICNVENAAGGSGLTPQLYEKFLRYGIDVLTMGDHIYRRTEIIPILEKSDRIIRPANLPASAAGKSFVVRASKAGPQVAVISLLGRLFMKTITDCPFQAVDRVLRQIPSDVKIIVVDMHGEATSEKIAMGWHLDGRASLLFGTHTHVQTADNCILPGGMAYISDVGMSGPFDSILGRRKDRVLPSLLTGMPYAYDVASGDPRLCGIIAGVDSSTGKATRTERIVIDKTNSPCLELPEEEND